MSKKFDLIAICAFGLESIVANELRNLGYHDLKIENGRVHFQGEAKDIVKTNIWLRCAGRIVIKVKEFRATDFDTLFDETNSVDWSQYLTVNGKIHVNCKSVKSKLFSMSDCQAIVKKSIIESLKRKYKNTSFKENAELYKINISILKDNVTLTLDTTGPSLHKRGYRLSAGLAPLKETLAAALVIISRWEPSKTLADQFCGSGTIPIEAALIGKNIAPGINRSFVSEEWKLIDPKLWENERNFARSQINDLDFRILGSDMDGKVLKKARENAKNAGVEDYVVFQKLEMSEFKSRKKFGYVITNPPYGERFTQDVNKLYKEMNEVYKELEKWNIFILSSYERFQFAYGRKPHKNRKLYNGKLKCYLYQYFN